jgi:hypothetical protein
MKSDLQSLNNNNRYHQCFRLVLQIYIICIIRKEMSNNSKYSKQIREKIDLQKY